MDAPVKICGMTDSRAIEAAARGGADWIGLVFFPPSPRALTPRAAAPLAAAAHQVGLAAVGVFVDPDDRLLAQTAGFLDLIQLHGAEPPARVAEVRSRFGLPVIKAIAVAGPDDLAEIGRYDPVADYLLFDTKAPKEAALPGGRGERFDWTVLADLPAAMRRRSLLSGGLNADNVAAALRLLPGIGLDVSSGVEDKPGVKDPARIAAFLAAAARAAKEGQR